VTSYLWQEALKALATEPKIGGIKGENMKIKIENKDFSLDELIDLINGIDEDCEITIKVKRSCWVYPCPYMTYIYPYTPVYFPYCEPATGDVITISDGDGFSATSSSDFRANPHLTDLYDDSCFVDIYACS